MVADSKVRQNVKSKIIDFSKKVALVKCECRKDYRRLLPIKPETTYDGPTIYSAGGNVRIVASLKSDEALYEI